MHKVLNYGSALQAYALQKVLEDMGHDVEIIDYVYPNEYHKQFQAKPPIWRNILSSLINYIKGNSNNSRQILFDEFYSKHFNLSKTYNSPVELCNNPPVYDIYLTGSDQVWNPNSIHEDTSFMLSFTDSNNKIAFSASFSTSVLPKMYRDLYATELKKYSHIYMREESGCRLVKELTGKESQVVLDPTLLLDKNQWLDLARHSTKVFDKPYILVYILGYSFKCYPYIYDFVKFVQRKTGKALIILNMSNRYAIRLNNKIIITDASVYDFIKLFAEADMVVTDSFHGTAFSLNFGVPFYSVVNDKVNNDSRILNLLSLTGETHRAITHMSDFTKLKIQDIPSGNDRLNIIRQRSLDILKNI